jgi:hypothetical protein
MAKSKRKPTAAVKRPQVPLQAPVPSHSNQGVSLVLGLKSTLGTLDGAISHVPRTDLPPSPVVIPFNGAGSSSARKADGSPVDISNAPLDGFHDVDRSEDEELGEEHLVFSCSEDDLDTSSPPSSPAPVAPDPPASLPFVVPAPPASPKGATFTPPSPVQAGNPSVPSPVNGKWRDLFSSNRTVSSCTRLMHFSALHDIQSCPFLPEDLDHSCDDWKLCAIGYVSGKFPGYRALNSIIENVWNCEARLSIHESGWLVYKFQNEEDKFSVLCGGPYLVYGRPLILRPMSEYFDFSNSEMSQVPVWLKFPNLPLKCWTPRCLSKLASVLGKPLQCDKLTATKERVSFAPVLVEIDLLADRRSSINITLPNGNTHIQRVIYETLPKFCKHCKVLGHSTGTCSKSKAKVNTSEKVDSVQVTTKEKVTGKGSVFTPLSPSVATQVDGPPVAAPLAQVSQVAPPPEVGPELAAPSAPSEPCVVQVEQPCSQPTVACADEWHTVRKKKHNSGNKRQASTSSLPAECILPPQSHVPSKGKAPALSVGSPGSKAPHRPGPSVLTRSSVQRIPNKSSGSGGIAPTLPLP